MLLLILLSSSAAARGGVLEIGMDLKYYPRTREELDLYTAVNRVNFGALLRSFLFYFFCHGITQ
jgi:hypothetical protein